MQLEQLRVTHGSLRSVPGVGFGLRDVEKLKGLELGKGNEGKGEQLEVWADAGMIDGSPRGGDEDTSAEVFAVSPRSRQPVTVLEGNIGNSFTIDPILGSIKTAKELDRSNQVEYDLMVKATDKGSPPLSEITSVHIFVTIATMPPRGLRLKNILLKLVRLSALGVLSGWSQPTVSHRWSMK
ncbi:hypothetical protein QTO34_016534 [Cnephaeus nilssonii]|uniref:Cadherin domain-containing protein n=1 Tax=Cnephaeus nilssonii TaxID=3371016 RepID=A0AA40I2H0_CNENI|nr:hypothetical protein QTO34_016534 [Eptesicus nilssonii]